MYHRIYHDYIIIYDYIIYSLESWEQDWFFSNDSVKAPKSGFMASLSAIYRWLRSPCIDGEKKNMLAL